MKISTLLQNLLLSNSLFWLWSNYENAFFVNRFLVCELPILDKNQKKPFYESDPVIMHTWLSNLFWFKTT